MPLAEVGLGALAPGTHEPVVQAGADRGTDQRNHAPRPLLNHLSAGSGGDTLDHARDELVDDFLLQQLAADVDPGRAGSSNPELRDFSVGVELKTIYQAQLLDGAHGYGRKNAEIGKDRNHPAEAETSTLQSGEFHAAADEVVGHRVKFAHLQRIHSVITADWHSVGGAELYQELIRIDLNSGVCAREPLDKRLLDAPAKPRFGFHIGHLPNVNPAQRERPAARAVRGHGPLVTARCASIFSI